MFFTGKNVVHQLSVSLEDLYNGATRKLALQKNVICDKCEGKFSVLQSRTPGNLLTEFH